MPAHLWSLWSGRTKVEARKEWFEVYRRQTDDRSVDVQYVDEDGNPIDPSAIDVDSATFSDEFGRPTDKYGNLISETSPQEAAVHIGESLLRAGKLRELIQHCEQHLDQFKESSALWRLVGVAHGSLGNPSSARLSFLEALQIDSSDSVTLANYVTACFDTGAKEAALASISMFFDGLSLDGQRIVLDSLLEAIKSNLVTENDLPDVIRRRLVDDTND